MSRARRRTVKALIVLASVFAFLSIFGIWIERQALNTDDWVHTSGRLIQNDKIRTAVGDYIVDQLYENVDVKKELEEILPGDTKDLAGPAAGGLRQVAGDGAERVLETSTAQSLWEDANRTAHEQLIAVLEDKKEAVSTEGGAVSLNLGSLVTNLANQVGIGNQSGRQTAARCGPDRDPAVGRAEDGPEHRRRDQRPGLGLLDPHLRLLRARDLPLQGRPLGRGAVLRRRPDRGRLRGDRRPPDRRRHRRRPAGQSTRASSPRRKRPGRSPPH